MLLRLLKGRRALQFLLLTLAILLVIHGLTGPQVAPRNMATVLTWVHYRGLLVIALLAAGNLFCASCPMILVRDAGRRFWHPALRWPRRLRGKWLGLALLVAVLFAYELFDLWQLPSVTAWLIVGYFASALVVDVTFSGATFCKHLCPIGQFNFVASTLSPLELQARSLDTCSSCATVDCIKGRPVQQDPPHERRPGPFRRGELRVLRGCELALFMPAKVGNLDCTLCGDCVRACPHDNIALVSRVPGAELLDTRWRSGIGWLAERKDMAALFTVFALTGLLNAFAMTSAGATMSPWTLALLFTAALIGGLLLLPGPLRGPGLRRPGIAYAYALAPLGVGIWVAHYLFHFLTGAMTVVPVVQAAAIDATGAAVLGEPAWRLVGMQPGSVFPIQIGFLMLGAAGSLGLVHAIARRDSPDRPISASLPWLVFVVVLVAAATWTLTQQMAMRGVR